MTYTLYSTVNIANRGDILVKLELVKRSSDLNHINDKDNHIWHGKLKSSEIRTSAITMIAKVPTTEPKHT